jgi:GPI ethanolamine phosphate transferase 1
LALVASFLLPFFHRLYPNSGYLHRLVVLFLTFSPTFIILTISYEGLFYFVFCMTLVTWVRLEHAIYASRQNDSSFRWSRRADTGGSSPVAKASGDHQEVYRALTTSEIRVALFFFFLLQSAFFSTGNIASVSSFSLESVYRLIPVFDPFGQGALLIVKLLIPFAVISANLGILNRRLEVAPSALFMLVMTFSDVMTLNFFYMVRDEGSWLDIGTTISHFCIASLLCVFVAGLEFLSETIISGVDVHAVAGPKTAAALAHIETGVAPTINGDGHEMNGSINGEPGSIPEPSPDHADASAPSRDGGAEAGLNGLAAKVPSPTVNGAAHGPNGASASNFS